MAQYIYILINPSLPGLLKIGRTNRSPEQRAIELSNGTNMPTPFVVAYEEEVPDSAIAEQLVHEMLTEQGFRVSDNREFFSIPLKIAIQIISQVAQQLWESTPDADEFLDDVEIEDDSAADYYLMLGWEAFSGSENTLQDFEVAREFFERAIALGSVQAHLYLASLYTFGKGVGKSPETALKILKAGADKGDPACFKEMWTIYGGQYGFELKHDDNAERCFRWFLDASKESAGSDDFRDYLEHSYEELGGDPTTWGELKFPISQFPGKHVSTAIDMWIEHIQQAFRQLQCARLADVSIDQFLAETVGGNTPSVVDVFNFQKFLSNCVQHGDDLMKRAMAGVEKEDLNYCFSRAENIKETVDMYMPYISAHQPVEDMEQEAIQENYIPVNDDVPQTTVDREQEVSAINTPSTGFFSRFFSRK